MAVKKREIPKPPKAKGKPKGPASARPPAAPKAKATAIPAKDFMIADWDSSKDGKRILLYGESGMGKTTLASLAPKPVFIGVDDGGKLLINAAGNKLRHVPGVECFGDVRAAMLADIYQDDETVVLDQATYLEEWAVTHILATITNDKGAKMDNIIRYGYNKGYRHMYDTMKLILQDADSLIHRGKNVIIIAQMAPNKVANPGGEDFLREGPRLFSGTPSIEALYCEWADHIFRIGYQFLSVDNRKVTGGENKRAVFVHPQPHFRAKSRTLGPDKAVVAFDDPKDNSIWTFLFEEGG